MKKKRGRQCLPITRRQCLPMTRRQCLPMTRRQCKQESKQNRGRIEGQGSARERRV